MAHGGSATQESPPLPIGLSQYPTWKKTRCMHMAVLRLSVREKRKIFALLRESERHDANSLLSEYGITIGDFCLMHILSDQQPS